MRWRKRARAWLLLLLTVELVSFGTRESRLCHYFLSVCIDSAEEKASLERDGMTSLRLGNAVWLLWN
jgi:hypothetical protein